jgi:RimJ/RimL family protein N-acetyltransferase
MIELPLSTARLTIRRFEPGDAGALAAYRSHPDVARFQSWEAPFSLAAAEALLASQSATPGPRPTEWVQLAVEHGGAVVGDVAVHLDERGAVAEIGYTLHPDQQGQGLASEAVGAVVDALLADGVHRVEAGVDPRNLPSRRLLERLGFVREGTARQVFPSGATWDDDERWALLRDDRSRWLARPGPPADVRFVELGERPRLYGRLATHPSQEAFVATVWESYADALFPEPDDAGGPLVPWLRGVEADGEPAGFVMTAEPTATNPVPYLWRLLIDRRHQGRGIGRRVLALLAERYREQGHTAILTSWVEGPGGPEPFYRALGFVPTGDVTEGEVVARLEL